MENSYPSFGSEVSPLFRVGVSADTLVYAAGCGLTAAEVDLHHRRDVLQRIRTELDRINPENFNTQMVADVYPLVSDRIQWEAFDSHPESQYAHVPLPQAIGADSKDYVGVAWLTIASNTVRVFSYKDWDDFTNGKEVPGLLVEP